MSRRRPATVLYVAWAPFFSGAERALLILLESLDRSRFRPVVAIGTHGELEAELRARDIRTVYVPVAYTGVRTLPGWLMQASRLMLLAVREHASLLHSNEVPSFQLAGYVARLMRRPAVTHVRFPLSRSAFEWFLKPGFDRALFVSSYLRTAALEEAPEVFRDRSDVVHDGVRMPELPGDSGRRQLREEMRLPMDRTIVALTGQVAEVKGIWEFIDAAAALIGRGLAVTFVVLGDDLQGKGALRARAEKAVAERGLSDDVKFLGFRPDAPRLIPAFDIVAVPSHVEPLGNATLEAMAAGLPVVGSRVGGIPEMVVEGETGLLVPSRDATRLANALEALIRDPERARAFGRAGRKRASEAFSVAAHVNRVQAVYDGLLGP